MLKIQVVQVSAIALFSSLACVAGAQEASRKGPNFSHSTAITRQGGAGDCGRIVVRQSTALPMRFYAEPAGIPALSGLHSLSGALKVDGSEPVSSATECSRPEFSLSSQDDKEKNKEKDKEKEAEELKKAIEFYNKFPPPDWGPVRHTLNVQKMARGQTLLPIEREFEAGYPDLWEKGRAASEKNEKK